MTLQEILSMISLKFPHNYADPDIITMVNDVQRRIFRTMYKPDTGTTYDLLAGNPFYPISFAPESIIDVVVNGKEYPYQNIKYNSQGCYYYVTEIEGDLSIGIYPTPIADVVGGLMVFRYIEPRTLVDVDDIPDLDPVWHMLIVLNVCEELAGIDSTRSNMQNIFNAEVNKLEKQFYRSRPARPHRIQDVYGVGRGAV
ncbi:hypothetical protein DVH26_07770 [Paenibacillus sp. H1-7]|uniref:phage adaptor protein n=1 Tax=Paenibacillus sp. H1-7 TaxID=2282849 RepID=UPI001EF81EA8|nr:hypothetical protein [Paenibacillus sp. H1-7]ULL14355.1 hypothetical protein DVH26_07770 [Paenibacillus sp. H1-7]